MLMKIVFLNRYFYPDHSATSLLLMDLALFLASQGRKVQVITSRQRYDEPAALLQPREVVHGVEIWRVWTSRFGRVSLPGRAFDYLTFYFSTLFALLITVSRGDIVVAKTDPPLLSLVAAPVAWLKGARLVNWLQDVFPEIAGAVGLGWTRGWVGRFLARLRDGTLRSASVNVVPGSAVRRYLISRGIAEEKVRVIANWADGDLIHPVRQEDNHLRREWGLEGKFVVGYSGNMGRVHEFETILGAAESLKGDNSVIFLFIGDGAQKKWLEDEVSHRGLVNVRFLPYQPTDRLAESLSAPDVHLVSLRPEVEGLAVPSKFYGIAAAGRPTLFVGDQDGEIGHLIREAQCGIAIGVGDGFGLVAVIDLLRSDSSVYKRYCENARRVFEERFEKRIALAAWGAVLAS